MKNEATAPTPAPAEARAFVEAAHAAVLARPHAAHADAARRLIDAAFDALAVGHENDARYAATDAVMAATGERHARKALLEAGLVDAL